jgi:hypothetical protein
MSWGGQQSDPMASSLSEQLVAAEGSAVSSGALGGGKRKKRGGGGAASWVGANFGSTVNQQLQNTLNNSGSNNVIATLPGAPGVSSNNVPQGSAAQYAGKFSQNGGQSSALMSGSSGSQMGGQSIVLMSGSSGSQMGGQSSTLMSGSSGSSSGSQSGGKRKSRGRKTKGGYWANVIQTALVPFGLLGLQNSFANSTRKHRKH